MKRVLCIISQAPYRNSHSLEALEALMVAAAFEMQTTLLFRNEGVWHLQPDQDAAPLGLRTLSNVLTALPTYEVDQWYACEQSLAEFGVKPGAATPMSISEQGELVAAHDVVLGNA